MKKSIASVLAAFTVAGALSMGCAYGGVSGVGADKVVIARNDGFLFGILAIGPLARLFARPDERFDSSCGLGDPLG